MSGCNRHVVETQRLQLERGMAIGVSQVVLALVFSRVLSEFELSVQHKLGFSQELWPDAKKYLRAILVTRLQIRSAGSSLAMNRRKPAFRFPIDRRLHHVCRPVKLVGEDYSQVLMLLDEDDGLSHDFRGIGSYWCFSKLADGQERCFWVSKSSVPRRGPVLSCRDGCL